MHTGQDLMERAMLLLGYTDEFGGVDGQGGADLLRRGCAVVNQIYADLWFAREQGRFMPLNGLTESIRLPAKLLQDVMPYGVAMLLADVAGDGEAQARFAALYNMKRAQTRGTPMVRRDSIPRVMPG